MHYEDEQIWIHINMDCSTHSCGCGVMSGPVAADAVQRLP